MLLINSTVELVTVWASSSPLLVAFCLSHVVIAVLLLGTRGRTPNDKGRAKERITGGSEVETPCAAQTHGGERKDGEHHHDPVTATAIGGSDCGCAEQCFVEAGEVDAASRRPQAREKCSGRDGVHIAADSSSSSEEERRGDEEDELMMRAEEFIQRMNRVWRTESLRVC
ncbi:uncharacterized protein LOC123405166 [Hordeum vulgare subsp. vulgare]|uniref:Uncharacterized protein n=1 Tax=Hordeum vulgare subsp. vulgare TaxID=112509 RepID=A0A8I6YIX6_HORVV|nr:uncharacterized protein LOC123405166 [Hordeum vulgare subsp. vulgare]